jgi:hypothetical protein
MTDIPKIKVDGVDAETEKDLIAMLYALQIIRSETGHGTLEIEIRDGKVAEMRALHKIRPKYMKAT